MSKRSKRHLAPVPPAAPQAFRSTTERIEIPTGGRRDVDGLIRELARTAFPGALAGLSFELDRHVGSRCTLTVATHEKFTPEQVDAGKRAVIQALLVMGVLKVAKKAEPAPAETAAPEASEDGAKSPLPQSQPT